MEHTILSQLLVNEQYGRKILPYLNVEYFTEKSQQLVFQLISEYVDKYNDFPTKQILVVELNNKPLSEQDHSSTTELLNTLETQVNDNQQWLLDKTEQFCQDKAIFNAIKQSIKIIDGKTDFTKNAIPKILQDALQVSFSNSIGHDLIADADQRYDTYHMKQRRIDFDLEYFNKITNGGLPPKTLNCLLGGTGTGKSMVMCHMASHNLMCQRNVLYITLEMAEERIAQRIDANLLDVNINDIDRLSKQEYLKKVDRVKATTKGRLIIKEYPTATASSSHFRVLLNDLRIKKNFIPDIIYIDYLNLCTSSRIKHSAQVNSYSYVKAIAEELRGLAVEFDLPIMTATQANRAALNNSDIGLENTSDSLGLPMTLDFLAALIVTEELEPLGQMLVKQLKNRYGDPSLNKKFVIGVDKNKMRLYNVEQSGQQDLTDGPVMDQTNFGLEETQRNTKFDLTKFKGFK